MKRAVWRHKEAVEKERFSNWFALPHIDDRFFVAGQQYLATRPGRIKNQNGENYMFPNPCGGRRLWFGVRSDKYKMFEGKTFINSQDSPIYAKVDFIPEDCRALGAMGVSPSLSSEFFENTWNFYVINYLEVLDNNGPVLNRYGNPERNKLTRLMTPKETSAYCRGWISALHDFSDDGLAILGHKGLRADIVDYFAGMQSLAENLFQIYPLSKFSLPKSGNLCLPVLE